MRLDKLSLLTIILLETLVLFCLGVLGSRVAELANIPNSLLLFLSAIGIVLAAYISYIRQSHSSDGGERSIKLSFPFPHLSLSAIWQRINPRDLHYSEDTETTISVASFGTAFVLGAIGVFFWEPGPGSTYSLFAVFSIAITFIPLLVVVVKGSPKDSWGEIAFNLICVAFLLSSTVTGGMLFGGIIMLILRLLGIRD